MLQFEKLKTAGCSTVNFSAWKRGVRDGIPICLGYFAVSFTFGMMAVGEGLAVWQAVLISAANITSAGQFAGLPLMVNGAPYVEMALTQFIINLRYSLMSFSLSQKIERQAPHFHRFFIAYGVTDEIFGVTVSQPGRTSPAYSYGVMCVALPGWVLGTLCGAVSGNLLPDFIVSALGLAIYGMFLAIIIPPAKKDRVVCGVVICAMLVSAMFRYLPPLRGVSYGFVVIITTLLVGGAAAFFFPIREDRAEEIADEC